MSRIGVNPIAIPAGVDVAVNGGSVSCKGPKGHLDIEIHSSQKISVGDKGVVVERSSDEKFVRSMHGTTRALLANAIHGVHAGYKKALEIQGVGYRVQLQGKKLVFNIGFCHQVEYEAPEGITFTCPDQTHVEVEGIDKQSVGQVAAEIRAIRKPEPYKGKGIRYVGEQVRRKAGKSAKK